MGEAKGQNLHAELKALIESERNRELECRKYLPYAKELLVKITTKEFLFEDKEYRGHSGDSDYIIVCKACDEAGIESEQAYIWEVKAPQCYVFEQDTMNRVKPTKEFISAENQLLHYYEECKGSDQFRAEFKITHPENVKLGGIVIGSRKTLVKSTDYTEDLKIRLYTRALDLRRRYLYGHSGVKVIIWDTILDHLQEMTPACEEIIKPESAIIEIKSYPVNIVVDSE